MNRFTCRLVQFDSRLGSANDDTLGRMREAIETADAELVVFPELATTGYNTFDTLDSIVESVPGRTTAKLGDIAQANDVEVVFGMPVEDDGDMFNSAIWLDSDGEVKARYNKRHLWGDERDAYTPGSKYLVVDAPFGRVGVQICYDLAFAEASAALAQANCDVFVNISAWSFRMERDWDTLLPARAIEQGAYVLGCNRAGTEPSGSFCGRSTVIEPDGTRIVEMGDSPGYVDVTLDPGVVETERARNPIRKDRPETTAEFELV
ncbi:Carbon-nitrogen hydrolase [Halogranum amylolyticum]|uniref:Carbon-nitrogen hydrolase n=1 Tax=Halogranum amylolyticum TaxID=660520 RepID=A0A1H8MSQ3_9EURY|nr:carbon-nitrogen hydrolase family protein [Halogranum amylolyticum]SEO20445.1 Carbon-nitrogen hydrolase [Halogranum amylolyticum]